MKFLLFESTNTRLKDLTRWRNCCWDLGREKECVNALTRSPLRLFHVRQTVDCGSQMSCRFEVALPAVVSSNPPFYCRRQTRREERLKWRSTLGSIRHEDLRRYTKLCCQSDPTFLQPRSMLGRCPEWVLLVIDVWAKDYLFRALSSRTQYTAEQNVQRNRDYRKSDADEDHITAIENPHVYGC